MSLCLHTAFNVNCTPFAAAGATCDAEPCSQRHSTMACRLETLPPVCQAALRAVADAERLVRLTYSGAEVMVTVVRPEELHVGMEQVGRGARVFMSTAAPRNWQF